jgi:hypothetical protein
LPSGRRTLVDFVKRRLREITVSINDQQGEQVVAVCHVPVNRRRGDTKAARDLAHRERRGADFGELFVAKSENSFAHLRAGLGVAAARSTHAASLPGNLRSRNLEITALDFSQHNK